MESELVADNNHPDNGSKLCVFSIGLVIWEDDYHYKIYWSDGPVTTEHSHGSFLDEWRRNIKKLMQE